MKKISSLEYNTLIWFIIKACFTELTITAILTHSKQDTYIATIIGSIIGLIPFTIYEILKNNSMSPQQNLKLSEISARNNNFKNNSEIFFSPSSRNNYKKVISDSLSIRLSPERTYGPIEVELCDICKQMTCTCGNLQNNNNSIINRNSSFEISNNNYNYNIKHAYNSDSLSNFEKNQFNDFLKALMEGEKQIELHKIDLALKSDFNCEDAFRIFEKDGQGYLNS